MFGKTIETKRIYKGRIVGLREDTVELSAGRVAKREIVEHPGAVAVIAIVEGKLILIRQFRKPAEDVLLEIPAGLIHKGETAPAAARRELEEEAGYRAGSIREVISSFSSPGYSTEIIRYFLAKDLEKAEQKLEGDEVIEVELIPVNLLFSLIKSGKIRDNKTIIGCMIAERLIDGKLG